MDQIPDDPEDKDEDETSYDDDPDKVSNSGDIQQDSDKDVDYDHDPIGSWDQDELMLKANLDTILLNDNILNSGGCSGKYCTRSLFMKTTPQFLLKWSPLTCPFLRKTSFLVLKWTMELRLMMFPWIWSRFMARKFTSFKQIVILSTSWLTSTNNIRRNTRNLRISLSCL